MRPKAFAVLRLLVEHPGQLVNKQQVLDTVWPGTFVGDAVLKDNIRQLREALHDDAESPTYIETAHRRGYRFIGKLADKPSVRDGVAGGQVPLPGVPSAAATPNSLSTTTVLGRDAELKTMRAWLDYALAGERQTVFITGEPGIGKTTIVQAFLEGATKVPGILVSRGQCLEHYGAGEPYLPLLDGFSRLGRSAEGTRVLEALRQYAPAWLSQMPSLVPQSERASLQAQVAGATRERMLREMAEAIEALSSEFPLILILEDLHWSDYSTLDLVSYLARRQDSARLMVIGTYRPVDVIVSGHPLKAVKRELQAHGLCRELVLEYLSEETVGSYLSTRFPGHEFPKRFRRAIHQRTEGNPLFMVNLVDYLSDQKIIAGNRRGWELQANLSAIERGIPANLRQLIEKQIERLSPDERAVLDAASVAGMECSCVAIAAGLDQPEEWVERRCEELAQRHQFLSDAWIAELPNGSMTPRHRFVHVLYRDVPYRIMAPMRRAQIHQRIAERGVAIYGDRSSEIAAELAMHFEQSRDWSCAIDFLLQAAENAATHSAHHEAIDLANRGLEAIKLVPDTIEHVKKEMKLRMILSASLMAIKGFASAEVEEINARGRELFWRQGPSSELFYMLWSLNMYQQFNGNMHTSLEMSHQLMQLAEDLNDGAMLMEARRSLAAVLVLSGRCFEALEHLEMGAALYAEHHDHANKVFTGGFDNKVMVEGFAALALFPLGYPDQSAQRMEACLTLSRTRNHPQTSVVALHIAAQMHQLRGEAPLVQAFAQEAMELADEYGLALWIPYGLIELGWAEAELGNHVGGIERMQRGLREYDMTGAKLRSPYFLGLLADQLNKAGRLEECLSVITRALSLAKQTGEGYLLSELHRIKGELFIKAIELNHSGKLLNDCPRSSFTAQARACFADALAVTQGQGARWLELRAALSMHRLDLMLGNPDHTRLATIYSSFAEGFETADFKQARARLEAACML